MLQRSDLTEFFVAFRQQGFVGIVQPISFAVHYGMEGLCIELVVVHGHVRVDGCRHLHTNESSVARKVGQEILVVARGDELGISAHFNDVRAVRFPETGRWFL